MKTFLLIVLIASSFVFGFIVVLMSADITFPITTWFVFNCIFSAIGSGVIGTAIAIGIDFLHFIYLEGTEKKKMDKIKNMFDNNINHMYDKY